MIPFPTDVRDPQFVIKANWFGYQQHQGAENLKAHDEFLQAASNWATENTKQLQQGLPLLYQPPVPPMQVIYNDDFSISHPPFPDLKAPSIDPKDVIPPQNPFGPGSGPGFVGVNPGGATTDSQNTLAALSQLLKDSVLIKAALKIKG